MSNYKLLIKTKLFAILAAPSVIWIYAIMKLFGYSRYDDITLWGVLVDMWKEGL